MLTKEDLEKEKGRLVVELAKISRLRANLDRSEHQLEGALGAIDGLLAKEAPEPEPKEPE